MLLGAVNQLAGKLHPAFTDGGELLPARSAAAIEGSMFVRRAMNGAPHESARSNFDELASSRPLLHSLDVDVPEGGALRLDVSATAAGNDFGVTGRETSPLSVYVNGKYHSDLFVMAERDEAYRVNLAELTAGPHSIDLRFSRDIAGKDAAQPIVHEVAAQVLRGDDALIARHAPMIETRWSKKIAEGARPVQTYSDVPLKMVAAVSDAAYGAKLLRYFVLSSGEDATAYRPLDLYRLFGRSTDLELATEVLVRPDGSTEMERFQGPAHVRWNHKGEKLDQRPIVRVATNNGMFSDTSYGLTPRWSEAPSTMLGIRTPPDRAIMLDHPWTFSAMGKELAREGRAVARGAAPPSDKVTKDARDQLYFEATDAARGALEQLKTVRATLVDGTVVDLPVPRPRRMFKPPGLAELGTALPLPAGITSAQIASLALPTGHVFGLDDDYRMQQVRLTG